MAEISAVGAINASWTTSIGSDVGAQVGNVAGSEVGAATCNLVNEAIGSALTQVAQQLQQKGMPAFLANDIKNVIAQYLQGSSNPVAPSTQQAAQTQFGGAIENFRQGLVQAIVDRVLTRLQPAAAPAPAPAAAAPAPAAPAPGTVRASGGSWMQAIAESMGKVMGQKAADMVRLSKEIADQTVAGSTPGQGQGQGADGAQGTTTEADKQLAAAKTQSMNAQFQATGQEFNLLQTTFSTAIKTIGEGMASIARKQ